MRAPLLLDELLAALKAAGVKPWLLDMVKRLYEVTYREAYAAGAEKLEDDDEL